MNSPNRLQQIESLFHAALEHEPAERADFLAEICGNDASLRDAVNVLLAAHDQSFSLLDQRHAGGEFDSTSAPTKHLPDVPAQPPAANPVSHSSGDGQREGRFVAGAMLAGRYRIVGLLGKGGMGEVYKAEDLKLNQTVALKFLPESIALDGGMLARFHNEVRIARQVAHPNVCRVYDIGEVEGLHFLSMEFIDGEDLSSLLRRIGRLPGDKAVEIARQMCAGLAAAHEAGVLHRDLKPANVMIDGRGKARITDFGLAVVSEELRGDEVMAGTPAYMSPEQLIGKEVTQRSDIYALGLVLYELFTGKRVFEAKSIQELISLHEKSAPPTPSSHVKEIDPLAERVILRCLEKEPKARPASAVQVALALPGGDPLAAALALGETPSPEMVAAAPLEGRLRPAVAVACLAATVIGLVLLVLLFGTRRMARNGPLEKSPEVLNERASEIARKLGYTEPPVDRAYGFDRNENYLQYIQEHDSSVTRWERVEAGEPAAVYFWYRQSPRYLVPYSHEFLTPNDPPLLVSGAVDLTLDPRGRLLSFQAVPPQVDEATGPAPAPDWSALFVEAGLDITKFTPTTSKWLPPVNSDSRTAWEGVYPYPAQFPLRIEAAAYRGRPVYFELIGPWDKPARLGTSQPSINRAPFIAFYLALLGIGAWLVRRNLRLGRGDRKGALRLAVYWGSTFLLGWVLRVHHVPTAAEFNLFKLALFFAIAEACLIWLLYLALEPYVRRRWPHRIIAWSRLLAGNFRDPLVGRDLLIGGLSAISVYWVIVAIAIIATRLGWPYYKPEAMEWATLYGLRGLVSTFIVQQRGQIFVASLLLFTLFLLTRLLRKEWLAFGVAWLIFTFIFGKMGGAQLELNWVLLGLIIACWILIQAHYGLLATVSFFVCWNLILYFPITSDFSAWYAQGTIFVLVVYLAICGYGFYTSLGGQKVFAGKLLEE
ncbi:MAG: serine/threonine-protein kinase [Blastocatellales bacterium]